MLGDRMASCAFLVLAGTFFSLSYSYPPETVEYVRFISGVLIVISILLFIAPPHKLRRIDLGIIASYEKVLTLLMLVAYVVIIPRMGYFTSSFIFSVGYMYVFERKGLAKHVMVSLIMLLVLYLVFQNFLNVWFPKGWLL